MSILARISHAPPSRVIFGPEMCPEKPRRAIHGLGVVYVDLTITPANVLAASGATLNRGTAGAAITAGQSLYIDAADANKLKLADADSTGKETVAGIALHAAASGQPIVYISLGGLNPGATVAIGTLYVLSATAGGICPIADIANPSKISIIGIGTTASNIAVSINNTGVIKA